MTAKTYVSNKSTGNDRTMNKVKQTIFFYLYRIGTKYGVMMRFLKKEAKFFTNLRS